MRLMFSRHKKQPPPADPSIAIAVMSCSFCPCPPVDIVVWPDGIESAVCGHCLDFVEEMQQAILTLEASA